MAAVEAIEFSLKFRIYDNALLLCEEYFTRTPTTQLLYLYARAYLESGSPIQAATLCKQYDHMIGTNAELRILYAQALFECGKYSEAEQILKRIELNTSVPADLQTAIIYLSGMIKLRTHRYTQAQVDFNSVLKLQPLIVSAIPKTAGDQTSQTSQLPAQRRSLMTPKQLRASNQSIKVTPKRGANGRTQLPCSTSSLLKNANNPLSVLKSMPVDLQNSIQALKSLACYHFRCAKYNEAARVFRKLYELHPHTVEGVDIFSTVLWQLKNEKELSLLARRAVELAPSCAEPWIATGNLLSLQHNTDAAIQMFQRAAAIDKSSSYALALAGHELLLFDSLTEAAKLFRQAIDRNPHEWSAWYGIGSVHFRQDNFNAAEYYMRKALDLNPRSSVLCYVYAMVLRKCGKDDEALPMFDKALELDPMNLVAAFQKGILLDDTGNVSGAIECLKMAEALTPHEPAVAFMRGKIAQSLGNLEEATMWFTDALIYGHPDKKEIHNAIESMSEKLIGSVLGETEEATEASASELTSDQ